MLEVKHFDARLRGVDGAGVLERAGHLALQTTSAFCRVNVKRLLHGVASMSGGWSRGGVCRKFYSKKNWPVQVAAIATRCIWFEQ
jgi:hypothetical protein